MLHEHVVPAQRRTEDVVVRELRWSLPSHTSHWVTHAAKASRTGRAEGIKTSTRRRGKSACTPSEPPADPRVPTAGKCRVAGTKHVAAPEITSHATHAQAARAAPQMPEAAGHQVGPAHVSVHLCKPSAVCACCQARVHMSRPRAEGVWPARPSSLYRGLVAGLGLRRGSAPDLAAVASQ